VAVKITTPGLDTYHLTCTECACRFTYERSDVRHNFRSGAEEISCPHCGQSHRHLGSHSLRRGCGEPRLDRRPSPMTTQRCQHKDTNNEQCRLYLNHLAEHVCIGNQLDLTLGFAMQEETRKACGW
jgi:hypothetical protein